MVELLPGFFVSRETKEQLEIYQGCLRHWNDKINLVSKASLAQAWQRHILDSAQLSLHLPDKTARILDFGSGAGFPGLVLTILGYQNVTLFEADARKCIFLREVARQTNAHLTICQHRIESTEVEIEGGFVVSRAFSNLTTLLKLLKLKRMKETTLLLLKGQSYKTELIAAQKQWSFGCKVWPSMIDSDGVILEVSWRY